MYKVQNILIYTYKRCFLQNVAPAPRLTLGSKRSFVTAHPEEKIADFCLEGDPGPILTFIKYLNGP